MYESHGTELFDEMLNLPLVTATIDERLLDLICRRRDAHSLESTLIATFTSAAPLVARQAVINMLPILCAIAPTATGKAFASLELESGPEFQAIDPRHDGNKASKALESIVPQASPYMGVWLPWVSNTEGGNAKPFFGACPGSPLCELHHYC